MSETPLKIYSNCFVTNPQRIGVGVCPSHEVKKKSFDLGVNRTHDLRIRSTFTLPTELRGRTEKVGDDLDGESLRRESKSTHECCVA